MSRFDLSNRGSRPQRASGIEAINLRRSYAVMHIDQADHIGEFQFYIGGYRGKLPAKLE